MNNLELRRLIFESGLKKYEIAEKVGINAATFSRWFQRELSSEKRQRIEQAIRELQKNG